MVAKPSTSAKVEPGVGQGPVGGLSVHGVLREVGEMGVVRGRDPGDHGPSALAACSRASSPGGHGGGRNRGTASSGPMSSHATSTGMPTRTSSGSASTRFDTSASPVGAVELHGDHDVGEPVLQGGDEGLAHDRVGVHLPGARKLRPLRRRCCDSGGTPAPGDGGCGRTAVQRWTTSRWSAAASHHPTVSALAAGMGISSGNQRSSSPAQDQRARGHARPHS